MSEQARRALRGLCILVAAVTMSACGAKAPADAPELRTGGVEAFDEAVRQARGRPVVVNVWASWCGPCRQEFPAFIAAAQRLDGEVDFLGVNARDSTDPARAFLAQQPTPYPHFADPDAEIARRLKAGRAWPSTAFLRADGQVEYTRQGAYRSLQDLLDDVRRYTDRG